MLKSRSLLFAVLVLSLTAPVRAQDLEQAKRLWRARQYIAVLRPLLDLRDSQPSFEIDYMLGTALCKIPAYSSDGFDFLSAMLTAYTPPYAFDGHPVDIRQAQRAFCPGPGVTESAGPITGAGTQEMRMRRVISADAIARSVRRKLGAVVNIPSDLQGRYRMVHDGWRGSLLLTDSGGTYMDSNGRTLPVRIASAAGNHLVFYILGLGGENADASGGQKFDGYFMTQTRDALAGTTLWQGSTFGFYAIKTRPE